MLRAIVFGFRNVLNLEGRDRRRVFWPYWLAVATIAVINLFIIDLGFAIFGDEARPGEKMPASGIPSVLGIFANGLLMIFLLFSACVRRLHDSGASMRWAVIVLGSFATFAMLVPLFAVLTDFGEAANLPKWIEVALFVCTAGFGLVASLGTYWMLYLLLRKGAPGANSYGPPPPKSLKHRTTAA